MKKFFLIGIISICFLSARSQYTEVRASNFIVKYDSSKVLSQYESVGNDKWHFFIKKDTKDTIGFLYHTGFVSKKPYPAYCRVIPLEITMWQLRAAITLSGLKPALEAALDQLAEPTKTVAKTAWEYANTILRYSPTIKVIQQLLNFTDTQIDDLFIMAYSIEA